MDYLYNLPGDLKFEVVMVLATKINALWDAGPCSLEDICQHFGRTCCLLLESGPLKMGAVKSYGMSVNI
jgi:hypothetical protein